MCRHRLRVLEIERINAEPVGESKQRCDTRTMRNGHAKVDG
jgi:hypothetical protein